MYDLMDLELARQHQEDLLREAHERRMTRTSGRTPSTGLTSLLGRLVRYLQPEQNSGLAAAEKPGVSLHGCSAD